MSETNDFSQYLDLLNEEQRQAVEHEGSPLLILAGAGSGKTAVLTERVMRKIGLEVPFAVELSQKLRVYNIVDELNLDLERLVSLIWK